MPSFRLVLGSVSDGTRQTGLSGPRRKCVGDQFALLEAEARACVLRDASISKHLQASQAVLVALLQRFEFKALQETSIGPRIHAGTREP